MLSNATQSATGIRPTAVRVCLLIFIGALSNFTALGSIRWLSSIGVPQALLLYGYVPAILMLMPILYTLDQARIAPFAFAGKAKPRHVLVVFICVICYLAFEVGVLSLAGVSSKVESQVPFFDKALAMSLPGKLAFAVMIGIVAPLAEELMFRQLVLGLFPYWKSRAWAVIGVLVSASLFAFAHLDKLDAIGISLFVFGASLLGALRIWSGGILLPFLAHAFNNSLAVAAMFGAEAAIKAAGV
ncbi:CPBP family intramembrane glutamic endopeptidase [Pseudomonas aeruginosa]